MIKFKRSEGRLFIYDGVIVFSWGYFVKYIISLLLTLFYNLVLLLRKSTINEKKYKVAICAIFKNETLSLKEWIEYHKIVGIERFYLYNNFSNDDYKSILSEYIQSGIVELIEWPVIAGQVSCYEHCVQTFSYEANWICFFDLDEFLCPIKYNSISEFLNRYKRYPSVMIYWKMFGTSGQLYHDFSKPIIEQYTVSWDKYYLVGKSIINTNFTFYRVGVHSCKSIIEVLGIKFKIPPLNEFYSFLFWDNVHVLPFTSQSSFTIQLNHYWSKAWDLYGKKMNNGDACGLINSHNLTQFDFHEKFNRGVDFKIFKYLINLKLSLKNYTSNEKR